MNPPLILIADDEPNIRIVLERALRHEGYNVDVAAHGSEALQKLNETIYDIFLLDLRMEPVDGLQVLDAARRRDPHAVVIILTAYSTVESAVRALRLGAYDYLFKPAMPETIRQRVREGLLHRQQALRRERLLSQIEDLHHTLNALEHTPAIVSPLPLDNRFVRSGKLLIDRHHRIVTMGDELLELTTAEFDVLLCLVTSTPNPLLPRQLVSSALGYDCDTRSAREVVKWHIYQLRQRIESDPAHPRYIKTIRYKGYLWSGE